MMAHFYLIKNSLSGIKTVKNLLFSILLIFYSYSIEAQIVYQEIIPSQHITTTTSFHADLNDDGIVDLDIVYTYSDSYASKSHKFNINTRSHTSVALENDSVAKFENQEINENLTWSYELENKLLLHRYDWVTEKLTIYGNWEDVEDGFVPIRLQLNGQYHYGWLRLHFIDNLILYAVDFAYNSIPEELIYAGEGYNNSISAIQATDRYNYFNGRDIELKFTGPLDATEFNEYRFIVARADDETALDLANMNQIPNDRYISLNNLQDDYVNSILLEGLFLDKNGDSINKFIDYRVHVLNVASSGNSTENKLSNPSKPFLLQAFVANVRRPLFNMHDSLIRLDDIIFSINYLGYNDFTKEFRAFLIPAEDLSSISVEEALICNRSYSMNIPYTYNNNDLSFSNDQLDINGNPIQEKKPYNIRILTVPDSVYAVQGKFSKESNRIMLNAPNFMQAGDTISSNHMVYNWDNAFSNYEHWTGNTSVQSSVEQEVDINRDGIPDFNFFGYNWHNYGSAYYLELEPYRDNQVLLCEHEIHENWMEVLDQDQLYGENYRWSNEYALLKRYESDGNGNSSNIGHFVGNDNTNEYYIAFKIEDGDTPQLAWVKLRGNQFIKYGFQDISSGVEDHSRHGGFMVYPNPATDNVNIYSSGLNLANGQVLVYNMLGEQMDTFRVDSEIYNYSLNHLQKGMYIMVIITGNNKIETHKLVVE